jgi:hypothetical protein
MNDDNHNKLYAKNWPETASLRFSSYCEAEDCTRKNALFLFAAAYQRAHQERQHGVELSHPPAKNITTA